MANGDKDRDVKTQVRFDNLKEGLVLGVRQGAMGKWEFFPPGKLPLQGQIQMIWIQWKGCQWPRTEGGYRQV